MLVIVFIVVVAVSDCQYDSQAVGWKDPPRRHLVS